MERRNRRKLVEVCTVVAEAKTNSEVELCSSRVIIITTKGSEKAEDV